MKNENEQSPNLFSPIGALLEPDLGQSMGENSKTLQIDRLRHPRRLPDASDLPDASNKSHRCLPDVLPGCLLLKPETFFHDGSQRGSNIAKCIRVLLYVRMKIKIIMNMLSETVCALTIVGVNCLQ